MYTLEKLSLLEGKDSLLYKGFKRSGNCITLVDYRDRTKFKQIESLLDIVPDYQIVLTRGFDVMNTSLISEILERTPTSVKFKTQTSVYLLTYVKDDDNET